MRHHTDGHDRPAALLPIGGFLLLALLGSGCGKGAAESPVDSAALQASGGVRADSGAVPMRVSDVPLTRQRLDNWRGAQRALSAMPDDTTFVPVRVADEVSSAEIDRAVAFLASRPDSRRAIEQSGLSIRDFVLTALALERARSLRAGLAGQPLPANLALATEFEDDLRRTRLSPGLHVVDLDDDSDDDSDRGRDDRVRTRDDRGDRGDSDRGRGRGHRHGKSKGKH